MDQETSQSQERGQGEEHYTFSVNSEALLKKENSETLIIPICYLLVQLFR